MQRLQVTFGEDRFNRLFPFYILIDSGLMVVSVGVTLEKLYPGLPGNAVNERFAIKRPALSRCNYDQLKLLVDQMVIIECLNLQKIVLRGQIEYFQDRDQFLFIGSPWFGSMEQVIDNKLSLHDFAFHDPMIDLLHVLKTQEITNEDLKHLLETVNQQKNELKKATRAKDLFLANMSHEIRTPMNAIMGMSNQLGKSDLDEEQQFYLDTIRSSTENLLIVINDILDLSKIEAGKLTLENIGFETDLLIDRAMRVMMHKAEEKGLDFTNSYLDRRISQVLIGDPYRLNQVLLNLISNAIKFTDEGGVDIICRLKNENHTHQTIQIRITDTGIGMDEGFQESLFNKFSQEDNSITRKYGGTGLGMNICNQLIGLMNGRLDVESEKGIGTTVTLLLEFEKGTPADMPKQEETISNTDVIHHKKILVVDDNDMNRLVATTILQSCKALVKEAANGKEAVDLLRKEPFDLVLMDVQMPVMDGHEAVQVIRKEISPTLPVIALTAYALKGEDVKNLNAGMSDYLSKPFEEKQFLSIVIKWLKKQELGNSVRISVEGKKVLFDLSKLEQIANGNAAFVEKMTRLFIDQATLSLVEIKDAYHQNDYETIKRVAHRLKPSIDNMNIHTLRSEVRQLESSEELYQDAERLESLIDKFDHVLSNVVTQLKDRWVA